MFHTAEPKDVLDGKITDMYFERTLKVLKSRSVNPVVKAELIAKNLPGNWPWAIFAVVDGYGIGTSISNAPVVDYSMDIMEIKGKPLAKRGKWSGSKRVLQCAGCCARKIVRNAKKKYICSCGTKFEDMLLSVLDNGNQLIKLEAPSRLRKKVLENIKGLSLE